MPDEITRDDILARLRALPADDPVVFQNPIGLV